MDRVSRRCTEAAVAAAVLLAAPASLGGQGTDEFVAAARRGTAIFRDRAAAIAAGYRLMGPESPAMGRHWVHPGLLLKGTIDPAHPQILSYATVGGQPVLVGVAYAVPAGVALPVGPAPPTAWHVHDGTVVEEAVQPDHDAHRAPAREDSTARGVAVLHAWIYIANPGGLFAADNWALPFVRLGLEPPTGGAVDAARALSLAAGSVTYYLDQLASATRLAPDAVAAIEVQLLAGADTVGRWLAARPATPLDRGDLDWLAKVWAVASREMQTAMADRR